MVQFRLQCVQLMTRLASLISARSRSATLRWTWPMRTRGAIGFDQLGIFKVRRRDEPSRPTVLIFWRFEFGEFFSSAIDIGFMRAAEREQFLLSMDVGFGGGEFGAFTFCREIGRASCR